MNDIASREYTVLRETIRSRGTTRPIAFLVGIVAWSVALVGVLAWLPTPAASSIPLLILLATFETVRALHLAVERIGRYIQVYFEEARGHEAPVTPPAWERAAMVFGPTLPGAGTHPFFLAVFVLATLANFLAVLLPGPVLVESATLGVLHIAFVVWIVRCDRAMRTQRATDLARFRQIRDAT